MRVGGWYVQFPDVPGCDSYGFTVDDAMHAASSALAVRAAEDGDALPPPRGLAEIEHDKKWLFRNDVELSNAVVVMIPMPL